ECKIGVDRNVVWAASGALAFAEDNDSVAKIIGREMSKGTAIRQSLDSIVQTLFPKLSDYLSVARKEGDLDNMDKLSVGFIFSYFEQGVLNIDRGQLKLPDAAGPNDNLRVFRTHCPNSNDLSCRASGSAALGQFETIRAEIASDPN